ncbi:hypothetical protein [Stenotrophomonas sp.]|uniref:hypothetical protein n=1 Tax=Stenotrophomonas sp. TaxID=69392 RepID=UPI0028A0301B|nr:hypothetical protein [Stenotrophomonas sp.]
MFSLVVGIGILYWCLWVAAAFWVFYPTALGAELGTFAPLSDEEYADLRRSAIDFARTVEHKGIVLRAGSERTRAFEFSCKGVPLLLVDNGPLLFVDVMAEADRRAPDLLKFRETMYSRLTPSGRPGGPPGPPAEPVGLEAFVLKHRDGIDVSQQCR